MFLNILREQEFCDGKMPISGEFPSVQNEKFPSVQSKLCVTKGGGIFVEEH